MGTPREKIAIARERLPSGKILAISEWPAGVLPDSPAATLERAISKCANPWARPLNAVATLQKARDIDITFRGLCRSATRASQILPNEYTTAKATPPMSPI
jgi:hypothetical protein